MEEFAEWHHKGNFDFVNGLWYGDYFDKALTTTELLTKFKNR